MTSPKHRAPNGFYYLPDDGEVGRPSVTHILDSISKPFLEPAAVRIASWYAVEHADEIVRRIAAGENPLDISLEITRQHRMKWDAAADVGSRVHAWAAAYALGAELPEMQSGDKGYVEQVKKFFDEWKVEPLYVEFECCSRTHDYAGSGDLIALVGNAGRVALIDYKTGKPARDTVMYPETVAQLNAYGHAEFILDGETLVPMPSLDCALGVSIRPRSHKVVPVVLSDEAFRRFLYVRHGSFEFAERGVQWLGAPVDAEAFASVGVA